MSTSLYNISAVLTSANNVMHPISSGYASAARRLAMGWLAQAAIRKEVPISISEISQIFGVSVRTVYNSIRYVEGVASLPAMASFPANCIDVTKVVIDKAIIALALDAHSSIEGIHRLLPILLGENARRSIGYISELLNRAGAFAADFNKSISLHNIRQGANDEIFDAFDTPVFTGVDVESTFIYLMMPMDNRTGESWQRSMEALKEYGLNLKVAISDAGSGLLNGIRNAFPDADIQIDVFHVLKDLGGEVCRFKRNILKALREYYDLENKAAKIKNRFTDRARDTNKKLKKVRQEIDAKIDAHDTVSCLYHWIHEMLSFSGYTHNEVMELLEWLLDEISEAVKQYGTWKLRDQIEKFRQRMPAVLLFLNRLFGELERAAQETAVPAEALRLLYHRLSTRRDSDKYWDLTFRALEIIGDERFDELESIHDAIISGIKRASSLVENVNSRLRAYMDIKRTLSKNFYSLVQLHLNTKKYRRSRVPGRQGKSPIELMTGEDWPEILGILEQEGFWDEASQEAA